MFRTLTAAAFFALSLTTGAQADPAPSLNHSIHLAAERVCAPLLDSGTAPLFYKKWFTDCVSDSTAKITADVAAGAPTSTALLPVDSNRR